VESDPIFSTHVQIMQANSKKEVSVGIFFEQSAVYFCAEAKQRCSNWDCRSTPESTCLL
jgi:hypothetical protein